MAEKLKIINIFKSIDGEAYNAGYPSVFLRTYGCNLRCAYPCDTPESWSMEVYNKLYSKPLFEFTPEEAVGHIEELAGAVRHVTVTGGEPLLPENVHWMQELARLLLVRGYTVDFETNGAVPLKEMAQWRAWLDSSDTPDEPVSHKVHFIMDWKCPSSKMTSKMIAENLSVLSGQDVVKCVVADEDFDEVLDVRARLREDIPLYISPSFGKVTMSKIPEFVVEHADLNLRCQLQQHKYFWDPTTKDV